MYNDIHICIRGKRRELPMPIAVNNLLLLFSLFEASHFVQPLKPYPCLEYSLQKNVVSISAMQPPVRPASSVSTGSPLPPLPTVSSSLSSPSPVTTRRQLLIVSAGGLLLAAGNAIGAAAAAGYDPVTEAERASSAAVSRRVGEAVELLDRGRELQARGEFPEALASFTRVVREYKDLALSEYARVGRALVLYEIGDRDESITEMEDVSVALKGYPEIHAALAAALYADKHAPLLAENQFAIATLLDPHYVDLAYVRNTKHWPPSLVTSLQHFITLS